MDVILAAMEGLLIAKELEVEEVNIIEAALVFRAIDNKLRRQLLTFIHQNEGTSVMPIYKKLRLEQSVASMHLAILRKAGVVNRPPIRPG